MHRPYCLCERPRVTLLDALANSEGAGAALAGRRGEGGDCCRGGSRGEQPREPPMGAMTERTLAGYRHARRCTYSIPCTRDQTGAPAAADPHHRGPPPVIPWYAREDTNFHSRMSPVPDYLRDLTPPE